MSDQKSFTEYAMICVQRREEDGVTAYLALDAEIAHGVVTFTPHEWTWSKEEGGANTREAFEDLRQMAIPLWRVTEIYWPAEEAHS